MGVTLYELLTLRPAFTDVNRARLIEKVNREEPPRPRTIDPRIPRDLETVVLKAMAKSRDDRYASAADLGDDLRRFLANETVLARRIGPGERAWRWSRRNPTVARLMVALILVFSTGLAGVTHLWRRAEGHRTRAEEKAKAEAEALGQIQALERAEAVARVQSQRIASNLALDRGLALSEAHEAGRGLHWIVQSLRLAPEGASALHQAARRNIAAWGMTLPIPTAVLPVNGPIASLALSRDGRHILAFRHGFRRGQGMRRL